MLVKLLEVEVMVVALGGLGGKPSPLMAAVCATHAPGSIGRTGSVRGIVKYPFGLGSQHFATTNLIGLKIYIVNWLVFFETILQKNMIMAYD